MPEGRSVEISNQADSSTSSVPREGRRATEKDMKRMDRQEASLEARAQVKEEKEADREILSAERQAKFCENFTTHLEEMQSRLTEKKKIVMDNEDNRAERLDGSRDTRDTNVIDTRQKQDEQRNAWYSKLEAAADTDAKQAALASFRTTVEASVEARRLAVDNAIETFRVAVDGAVSAKGTARAETATAFTTAVTAALDQAKADCAAGKDAKTVRSSFQAALKEAREVIQSDRNEVQKLGDQIRGFADTKRVAIQTATDTFHKTLDKARADLKTAFGTSEIE